MGKKHIVMLGDCSGCQYWRLTLPGANLAIEHDTSVHIVDGGQLIDEKCIGATTIVVQRLCDVNQFAKMLEFQRKGVRVIYDIDDDMFNIPAHNQASRWMTPAAKAGMRLFLEHADVVTTTTERLKKSLLTEAPGANIVVIPNAIRVNQWRSERETMSSDGRFRILWQGSSSHSKDWDQIFPAIDRLMAEDDTVDLAVIGYHPRQVSDAIADESKPHWNRSRFVFSKWKGLKEYRDSMYEIRADVALAPLEDEPFNSRKSNVKAVEYAVAGIPGIYSPVGPYKDTIKDGRSGLFASNADEWYEQLKRLKDGRARFRSRLVRGSREMVRKHFELNRVSVDWYQAYTGEVAPWGK